MLHTAVAGEKEIRLPGVYTVTEMVGGRKLGEGISVIEESLPAQATRIYQLKQ